MPHDFAQRRDATADRGIDAQGTPRAELRGLGQHLQIGPGIARSDHRHRALPPDLAIAFDVGVDERRLEPAEIELAQMPGGAQRPGEVIALLDIEHQGQILALEMRLDRLAHRQVAFGHAPAMEFHRLEALRMASAAGRKRFSFIVHSLNEAGILGRTVCGRNGAGPSSRADGLRVMVYLYTISLNAQ